MSAIKTVQFKGKEENAGKMQALQRQSRTYCVSVIKGVQVEQLYHENLKPITAFKLSNNYHYLIMSIANSWTNILDL